MVGIGTQNPIIAIEYDPSLKDLINVVSLIVTMGQI